MYRCVILNDDKQLSADISELISGLYGDVFECVCCDGDNISLIRSGNLIITGIKLRGINGNINMIDAVCNLKRSRPGAEVIFIGNKEDLSEVIFKADPVYYLSSPIDSDEFRAAMERAIDRIGESSFGKFSFNIKNDLFFIPLGSILYFESVKRQMKVCTLHGCYMFYSRIVDVEKRLDGRFFKCHQSFIVNMDHVIHLSANTIETNCGKRIPVSQNRCREIRERISKLI